MKGNVLQHDGRVRGDPAIKMNVFRVLTLINLQLLMYSVLIELVCLDIHFSYHCEGASSRFSHHAKG